MLFNSLEFLLFLPTIFAAYWILNLCTDRPRGLQAQNLLLLFASYVFYGWWDWRFLGLIAFSTMMDWLVGLKIHAANQNEQPENKNHRSPIARCWLFLSLFVNLGLLGYFKYANFFIESWVDAWGSIGVTMNASSLQIILPVGISFYTFQTLSYSIDIYRRQLEPTTNFLNFAAFVSFFPQLVAGPIERAKALLPQVENRRTFDYELAASGVQLILWGMFKKVVVADTAALYVNDIFNNVDEHIGPRLIFGAVCFAFQIYGDFSGYSDIAIGTARLFGIRLMTNFKAPYFSRDIAEFWRRWHISLSTWFRDYLYIPLGGSRVGKWKAVRNTFVIFLVSGFWHGANWTFVAWGFIHAMLFLPLLLLGTNRRHMGDSGQRRWLPSAQELGRMAVTFLLVTVAWVFFRAPSIEFTLQYLINCTSIPGEWLGLNTLIPPLLLRSELVYFLSAIVAMIVIEWLSERPRKTKELEFNWLPVQIVIGTVAILHSPALTAEQAFIYFQF